MVEKKKKIVVLGGGYGGVECTRKLEEYFETKNNLNASNLAKDHNLDYFCTALHLHL